MHDSARERGVGVRAGTVEQVAALAAKAVAMQGKRLRRVGRVAKHVASVMA